MSLIESLDVSDNLLCFSCRTLYGVDGRFIVDNINEWQHSAMYAAFMLSGIVDLVVFYTPQGTLPTGTDQVSKHHRLSSPLGIDQTLERGALSMHVLSTFRGLFEDTHSSTLLSR